VSKKINAKAKSKAPQSTKPKPVTPRKTTVILFGLDEQETHRGAQFVGEDDSTLARMAAALGLRLGVPRTAHQLAITNTLPKGDVNATGAKAVPHIEAELYEKLNALVGGEPGKISTAQPKSWDEIEPGHLVIAQYDVTEGWWPAVVLKRHDNNLVLKWRDFPGDGEAIRDVRAVALLSNDD
jgi:hypothetical protein